MGTTQDIFQAASQLPDAARVELIETLLATFDPTASEPAEAETEWRQLASQRASELDRGEVRTVSWDEVRQEGEKIIHDRTPH